jgi:uncharacterized protein DUF1508
MASNGEIIAVGEAYESKSAALNGIDLGCVKDLGQFLGLLIRQRLLLVGGR